MDDTIKIDSVTLLARNWGRFDRYQVTHDRRDGTRQSVSREVYDHGHGASVLMYAPLTGSVILARQFRLPAHVNGDPAWLIEAPAGMLDGETPAAAARREAIEETGYEPQELQFLFNVYMSPGAVTEKCACFLARYTPGDKLTSGGGLADEGEDIEVFEIAFTEALAMIGTGEICDAKTVLMLQALALELAKAPSAGQ